MICHAKVSYRKGHKVDVVIKLPPPINFSTTHEGALFRCTEMDGTMSDMHPEVTEGEGDRHNCRGTVESEAHPPPRLLIRC